MSTKIIIRFDDICPTMNWDIFLYIKETFSVDHIEICGRFLRRGGIDINPIRSSQKKLFFANFREFNQ